MCTCLHDLNAQIAGLGLMVSAHDCGPERPEVPRLRVTFTDGDPAEHAIITAAFCPFCGGRLHADPWHQCADVDLTEVADHFGLSIEQAAAQARGEA